MTAKSDSGGATADLFRAEREEQGIEWIAAGAAHLIGFAEPVASQLVEEVARIAALSPFRGMSTPGGQIMSVTTTSCGAAGWVSDRVGYRYERRDPATGDAWPAIPTAFMELAVAAAASAGYACFAPDACLINRYVPGARMSLHQDRNERDFSQPIVSVSLGLPAVFLFGGLRRTDRAKRLPLASGDVVVWGGASRMVFHGVEPVHEGNHQLTGGCRINLTFRRAL